MARMKNVGGSGAHVYTCIGNRELRQGLMFTQHGQPAWNVADFPAMNVIRWAVMYSNPLDVPEDAVNPDLDHVAHFRMIDMGESQVVSEELMAAITGTGVLFGTNTPPLVPHHRVGVYTPGRRVWIVAGSQLENHLSFVDEVNLQQFRRHVEEEEEEEEEEEQEDQSGGGQQDPTNKHDDASSGGAAGILVQ
jgi:hypothetical protein